MRNYFLPLVIGLGLLTGSAALAQRRQVGEMAVWPELQGEYALQGNDYALLGVRLPLLAEAGAGLQAQQFGLRGGYEHFWNTRWSWGGNLYLDSYSATRNGVDVSYLHANVTPEVLVRHWNTLGSYNFRQRLGVEYFIAGGPNTESRGLTRLRLDLDRLIPVGRIVLRPRVAYEGMAYLRLQRDESQPKERVIDYTSWRADLGVRLSDHFDLTPWFAYQTTYYFVLGGTRPDGTEFSGGRRNIVTPTLGVDLRYTLFRGKQAFERRQLPTQH